MGKDLEKKKVRLSKVLAAYGANPARWPQNDRAALESLLANQPELAQARALDHLLNTQEEPKPTLGAIGRVMAKTANTPSSQETKAPLSRISSLTGLVPISALLAASLLVGVFLGLSGTTEKYLSGTFGIAAFLGSDWGETSFAALQIEINEGWL
jgi:hypothetical protein